MKRWRNLTLDLRGERIEIDGVGFSAIGRLELLRLLQGLARDAGVTMNFGNPVRSIEELPEALLSCSD